MFGTWTYQNTVDSMNHSIFSSQIYSNLSVLARGIVG